MARVNPYISFRGNCEEAFNFYSSVFGHSITQIMRYKDAPPNQQLPASEMEKIMHISLPIGHGTILMGSDTPHIVQHDTSIGNTFSISVSTESEKEALEIFTGLSNGGKVTMPLDKSFWGTYFGMFTDRFGVQWMVTYDHVGDSAAESVV